jgi:hypothetical protein
VTLQTSNCKKINKNKRKKIEPEIAKPKEGSKQGRKEKEGSKQASKQHLPSLCFFFGLQQDLFSNL